MALSSAARTGSKLLLAAAAAASLAACSGKSDEQPTYKADATDASGGELIVTDASSPAVDVNLPETPMTNVPAKP